jgi:hypothetical protein
MNEKIQPSHIEREAYVYVRQSSMQQVRTGLVLPTPGTRSVSSMCATPEDFLLVLRLGNDDG